MSDCCSPRPRPVLKLASKHVRPDTQCAAAGHSSQRSQATSRRPADLLSVTSHERDCQRDSPTAKVIDFEEIDPLDRSASVELYHKPSPNETRPDWSPEDLFGSFWQPSSTQTRPQESVARRESLLCTYTIDAHMTMVDLVSASMYVCGYRIVAPQALIPEAVRIRDQQTRSSYPKRLFTG